MALIGKKAGLAYGERAMKDAPSPLDLLSQPAVHELAQVVRQRRATPHFLPDPVPEDVLNAVLSLGAEAPSGFNFQPWRFLVLRSPEQRARLRAAAFDQAKITEAPAVIVALADRVGWKGKVDEILKTKARRKGRPEKGVEQQKRDALAFIDQSSPAVWLTRQVMIAFTYLMLTAEFLGWDTAPMEGFDPVAVRDILKLPATTEVIALLAIGRAADREQREHPGRLSTDQIAFDDHYGTPWPFPPVPAGDPASPASFIKQSALPVSIQF